jgi:hypothetical protein
MNARVALAGGCTISLSASSVGPRIPERAREIGMTDAHGHRTRVYPKIAEEVYRDRRHVEDLRIAAERLREVRHGWLKETRPGPVHDDAGTGEERLGEPKKP